MPVTKFVPRVGRATIRRSVDIVTAQDTRATRDAMKNVVRNFEKFISHMEEVTPEILKESLESPFKLSQIYVPKDTHALARSGYLKITTKRGKPQVEIGYGLGGKPDYAATVHENMEFQHKAPTRSKFLQAALEERSNEIQKHIVNRLKYAGGF